MMVASCAAAFAGRIMDRHRTRPLKLLPLPRIMRRIPAATVIRTVNASFPLTLAPRIRLEHRAEQAASGPRIIMRTVNEAGLLIVERVLARSGRQASASAGAPATGLARIPGLPSGGAVVSSPEPPTIARVMRRPTPPDPAVSRRNGDEAADPTPQSRDALPARPAESLSAADLDRVTKHVVQRLDRRLTAWRERTGRI
jgi:hypothetical protein